MEKKNHTRLTVKRSNTEVEKKYLVEETHVLYHCSSSESKKRSKSWNFKIRERRVVEKDGGWFAYIYIYVKFTT